jgi:hypothetical protein
MTLGRITMNEKEKTIRKWASTEEYRDNHDRIFKKERVEPDGMFIHLELDDLEEFLKKFWVTDSQKKRGE